MRIGIGGKVGDNRCVSTQREIQIWIGRICNGNIPVQHIPEQKQFPIFFLGFKCHRNTREIRRIQRHVVRANVDRIDLNLAQTVYDDGQRDRLHIVTVLNTANQCFRATLIDEIMDFLNVFLPGGIVSFPAFNLARHFRIDDCDHTVENGVHVVAAEVGVAQVCPAVDVSCPKLFVF